MFKKLLFALLFILIVPASSYAEVRIAVLDLGQVLVDSPAMQDVDKQLKAKDEKLRADAKAKEAEFRERQTTLNQQRAILQPEQFSEKQRALGVEMRDYSNAFQAKVQQLVASKNLAIKKIEAAMEPIVKAVVKEVGANVVVERKQVIFATKELNITKRVSDKLNAKLTKMPVEMVPLKK